MSLFRISHRQLFFLFLVSDSLTYTLLLGFDLLLIKRSKRRERMGSTGKQEVEVEVKSKPEKFWHGIRESTTLFPKAMPEEYKRIDVVEGDGFSVGSVRLVHYGEGSPLVKVTHEKIDAVDEAKMTYAYSVIDGDLLKFYKNFKAFLVVEPKGDGSLVKWACEFEKASDEIPDPNIIRDFAVKSFKDLDSYLNA